jgi:Leucine-rich repeat (LRR) protein
MEDFDMSPFPTVHLLYVDCNHLSTVNGLEACEDLETLSIRGQTCAADSTRPRTIQMDLHRLPSLRKLYVSSNKLSPELLEPASPLPTLQFLDMASCALDRLPKAFGEKFVNLRALNLNFNALTDISGLEGVMQLGRLSLVGNRISRLRRLCRVLLGVGGKNGTLRKVDLRGNPITVGFYPAPILGNGKRLKEIEERPSTEQQDMVKVNDELHNIELPPLGGGADIAVRAGEANTLERRHHHDDAEDPELEIDIRFRRRIL